jgi:hypothetical protein
MLTASFELFTAAVSGNGTWTSPLFNCQMWNEQNAPRSNGGDVLNEDVDNSVRLYLTALNEKAERSFPEV